MVEASREVFLSRSEIARRVKEVAGDISRDYQDSEILLIGVLKGAFIFLADLARELTIPCQLDFIRAASYGAGSTSSGQIRLTKDIEMAIEGRDVIVVEDIIDTGLTLRYIIETLLKRNPRSIKVCVFLDKLSRREVPLEADYVCFTMEDGFVVGYGLDYNEQDRFLPDVCIVQV